jgi:trans-aconitate methyltransferase
MTRGHEWSAGVGSVWAEQWHRTDRTFAAMAPQLDAAIDRLAPPSGGRVADIGCGAGATSVSLARRRPDLDILGIDIAPQLVAVAEERGADLPNLTFSVGDAAGISATAAYDMLISRHGVMFFDDPVAAFAGLHAMAKPGAPIVFSCMRAMVHNRWAYDLVEAVTGRAPQPPAGMVPAPSRSPIANLPQTCWPGPVGRTRRLRSRTMATMPARATIRLGTRCARSR